MPSDIIGANHCRSIDQQDKKFGIWNSRRSQGKTKAISYWCHHPVQSGQNPISLSLHIYRKAQEQSSVASISPRTKMCSEQQSSSGLQKSHAPTPPLSSVHVLDMFCKTHTYQPRLRSNAVLLTCHRHAWRLKLFGTWSSSLLHVNCLAVLSSQSITHLLTSILSSPWDANVLL